MGNVQCFIRRLLHNLVRKKDVQFEGRLADITQIFVQEQLPGRSAPYRGALATNGLNNYIKICQCCWIWRFCLFLHVLH